MNLDLVAGENTVKFATVDGKDGPNIDQFDVTLMEKDSSGTLAVPMISGGALQESSCDVSIYGVDGKVVRNLKNVPQSLLHDVGELSRGLRGGVYLVRTTAPGANKQFFMVAK